MMAEKMYHAIAYYRLSKVDGKGMSESDSIVNQRKLIHDYVSKQKNICLVKEAQDDGFTGTNYDRPGFCAVMDAVRSGEVDCVIVKDLSRMGREYIETGKYLEIVFPSMGIRFIAVNDDVDSEKHKQSDDFLIPVKNLINESYCRLLSDKLRKQFAIQRKNGEFIGAFAFYGYRKCPNDKHKLIPDESAAEIVKEIFALKLQGYSQQAIADSLNKMGVLSPSEYKKINGLNYKSGFSSAGKSKWNAVTVKNILMNTIYIGELVQGKRSTPNFKVKKMQEKNPEEWVVVKNNHEKIIDDLIFYTVQKILQKDTRTSPDEEVVQPLSGIVFCPDCNRPMNQRSVTRGNKKHYYYVCSTNKRGKGCTSHSISKSKLQDVVFHAIQKQIQLVVEIDEFMREVKQNDILAVRLKRIDLKIVEKEKELDRLLKVHMSLYEALTDGIIERNEYLMMKEKYKKKIDESQAAIKLFLEERKKMLDDSEIERTWIDQFGKYRNIGALSRDVVVSLIDRICVSENKEVQIEFAYRDEMEYYSTVLSDLRRAGQYGA